MLLQVLKDIGSDAIEFRAVSAPRRNPGESSDCYLGMLYPTEDHKVFGYDLFLAHITLTGQMMGAACSHAFCCFTAD